MATSKLTKIVILGQTVAIAALGCLSGYLLLRGDGSILPASGPAAEKPAETTALKVDVPEIDWNYDLSGKKILLSDDTFGEIALPVYADVPACSKAFDKIINRNGQKFYLEDGKITSEFGIDISAHQKEIDWGKVKQSGVDFALLRLGYRTYGGGELKADERFAENYAGATAAGIRVGAYFFSQAVTEQEAAEEAQFALNLLENRTLDYPLVYDWELIYDDEARTDKLSCDVLTNCSLTFCNMVKEAGYRPMIYQNKRTTLFKLDLPRLQGIDFWLAEYSTEPTYYYDFQLWQYSCKGSVPGIEGQVDLNISFSPYRAPATATE